MASLDERVAAALQRLSQACADGERRYRSAATIARDPELRSLLLTYGHHRATFGAALNGEMDAADRAEAAAAAPEADLPLLDECARGDETILVACREALDQPLNAPLHDLVRRHRARIEESCRRLRWLESRVRTSRA